MFKIIITIIGGIGSGKTLSVAKIIKDNPDNYPITNFNLKGIDHHRLKYSDLITDDDETKKQNVNWDFWENIKKKRKNFSIYLDEAHNIIGSRQSMSKSNQLMSRWVSQIRKIMSDSPVNHLYIITQKPRRIDVNFRELTQVVIECIKKEYKGGKILIIQKYYDGFDMYEIRKKSARSFFIGNRYFKYYDTDEMVTFKDGDEFI